MTATQPENFSQFEKLLVDLARAGVEFAVVGGVAVSLNGFAFLKKVRSGKKTNWMSLPCVE